MNMLDDAMAQTDASPVTATADFKALVERANNGDGAEAELGRMLQDDPATVVFAPGLGAFDVRGNPHILRVDDDETWWRLLPLRLESLASTHDSGGLSEQLGEVVSSRSAMFQVAKHRC